MFQDAKKGGGGGSTIRGNTVQNTKWTSYVEWGKGGVASAGFSETKNYLLLNISN